MSFFAELKRRNVVRVGIAYVVIGWALAQVAEFAVDNFGAPDWTLKIFVVFLILGLPVVLFAAWAFEITPQGVKLERDVDRSQSITKQTGRKLDFIIIAVLVVAVGFLLVDKFYFDSTASPDEVVAASGGRSIAVLPFVNMSDDKDYFADGLSEELLNLLVKIPDLKVAGRTSSFAFKGKNEDLRVIGDALGVSTVLEGSVRRSGDRLRVTAQLIKVDDGFHLWSETYDRQMADIFDIQDDVAAAITDALKLHLSPTADRSTANTEAYALYLQALALRLYRGPEDINAAQELLDQAITLDPEFALAYELQSDFHWLASGWLTDAPTGQKLAYDSAMKALQLDPTLNDARSYAATARPDWTWIYEIEALEELLRKEPGNIGAMEALSWDLIIAGYFDESVQLAQQMIELEPLSGLGNLRKGEALFAAGRSKEARESAKRAAELDIAGASEMIAAVYLINGEYELAIKEYESIRVAEGEDPADIRPFVVNAIHPDTGKAFLDEWIEAAVAEAANIDELRQPYYWYLLFGHLDDYWQSIETLAGSGSKGWTNADTLEASGMVYRSGGFTQHPKYVPYSVESSLTELWDKKGAPDHCEKDGDRWVCE